MSRYVRCMICYHRHATGAVVYKDENGKEFSRIYYCKDHQKQAERKALQYADYKGKGSHEWL